MPSREEVAAIKDREAERLLSIPGVLLVGLGGKDAGGRPTGESAIKLFVERKLPAGEVPEGELIPALIDGVPTDVVQIGRIMEDAAAAPPGALNPARRESSDVRTATLMGGYRLAMVNAPSRGTLGCVLKDTKRPGVFYALTNQHVINAAGEFTPVSGRSEVGQPSGVHSWTCCDDTFGVYVIGERRPPTAKAPPHPHPDRDEGLIRIAPGRKWAPEVAGIGPLTGTFTVDQATADTSTFAVRKFGARTRLTGGLVVGLAGSHSLPDNVLVVKPNDNPARKPGDELRWSYKGDSGSVVVDDMGIKDESGRETMIRVVGLHWGGTEDGFGLVLPIANVLARFAAENNVHVDIATIGEFPGPQVVPEVPVVSAHEPRPRFTGPSDPVLVGVEEALAGSPAGRALLALWRGHRDELMDLVRHDRRVTVVWHRSGGASVFQLLGRMLVQPELSLPELVDGKPLDNGIDELHEGLRRFAGPGLRVALDRAHGALPNLAGSTYSQIVDALGRV